jgi:hypothetical protein
MQADASVAPSNRAPMLRVFMDLLFVSLPAP